MEKPNPIRLAAIVALAVVIVAGMNLVGQFTDYADGDHSTAEYVAGGVGVAALIASLALFGAAKEKK